jgi:hypothetical protein
VKVKLDENMPADLATPLPAEGHDAATGMSGQTAGRELVRWPSPFALASLGCLAVAGVVYLWGRFEADRLRATGQGFEMAFYLSPLVFQAVDGLVILGAVIGLIGAVVGRGWPRRLQAFAAGLLCGGCFMLLPWRGVSLMILP